MEVIFQIYGPQGHGILTMRATPLMSFLPLQDFALPPKAINSTDGQWKFMQGDRCFLLQSLTKLQKQVSPSALDLILQETEQPKDSFLGVPPKPRQS
jgi:hypothetical protein